jgi:hypothetical protein
MARTACVSSVLVHQPTNQETHDCQLVTQPSAGRGAGTVEVLRGLGDLGVLEALLARLEGHDGRLLLLLLPADVGQRVHRLLLDQLFDGRTLHLLLAGLPLLDRHCS